MTCPQGRYIQHIPEYVEKINAGQEFLRAYSYGLKQIPMWVLVDDQNNVIARSFEIDIDKALAWAQGMGCKWD